MADDGGVARVTVSGLGSAGDALEPVQVEKRDARTEALTVLHALRDGVLAFHGDARAANVLVAESADLLDENTRRVLKELAVEDRRTGYRGGWVVLQRAVEALPPHMEQVKRSTVPAGGQKAESLTSESAATTPTLDLPAQSTEGNSVENPTVPTFVNFADSLADMLQRAKGDMRSLEKDAVQRLRRGEIDASSFLPALCAAADNARRSGQEVRADVYTRLHKTLETAAAEAAGQQATSTTVTHGARDHSVQQHAPVLLPSQDTSEVVLLSAGHPGLFDGARISRLLVKASSKKQIKAQRRDLRTRVKPVADFLESRGWCVLDSFIPSDVVSQVRTEAIGLSSLYRTSGIWVGRGDGAVGAELNVPSVRGDEVVWMCGGHAKVSGSLVAGRQIHPCQKPDGVPGKRNVYPALKNMIGFIDSLVTGELSRCGGNGSRFQKHVDNTAYDGRRLTVLIYLNVHWEQSFGGNLRLFEKDGTAIDVAPLKGRVLLFHSDAIAHEVRETYAPRHACTLWYYDTKERAESLQKKLESHANEASKMNLTDTDRKAASEFLLLLLRKEDGISRDKIVAAAKSLKPEALSTVATVTGAADSKEFLTALQNLDDESLAELQESLQSMGLGV